jgi:hypothetical protein
METKSIFLSKTFWFNVLAFIVLVANGFGYTDFQYNASLDQYALLVVTVVNVVLRLATNKAVAIKAK